MTKRTSSYQIIETDSATRIEFLKHPDFPLGRFLLEISVLALSYFTVAVMIRLLFGPAMFYPAGMIVLGGLLAFPNRLIWNYWAKDCLEINDEVLFLNRYMPPFYSVKARYRPHEIRNIRVFQSNGKAMAFEGIFGLRLFQIRYGGKIVLETSHGMITRFGWGMDEEEAEEVVAIIQQRVENAKQKHSKQV